MNNPEKVYRKSINNASREVRYFSQPISLTLENAKLAKIVNQHFIHTSKLKLCFEYDDPAFYQQLENLWNQLPVEKTKGRRQFTNNSLTLNVRRQLDATFDSYGKQGLVPSVVHGRTGAILNIGDTGLVVNFRILATNGRGFDAQVLSVRKEEQLLIDDNWVL
jgi:hypothetical protein